MTAGPNLKTEPIMTEAGWTVQSPFDDQESNATEASGPSLCREAAQSNQPLQWTAGERFGCSRTPLARRH